MKRSVSFDSIEMPKIKHYLVNRDDVFECKTCHRQFSSFQALGGHRATSHKKPKSMIDHIQGNDSKFLSLGTNSKVHECGICGKIFGLGQALGGHMRKHRAAISKVPVLSRSNSKRVLSLDLNLTPLENDLQALLGEMAPKLVLHF